MAPYNTPIDRTGPDPVLLPAALRPQRKPLPCKLTIALSDRDLQHFRRQLRKTRDSVQIADDEEILSAATDLIKAMKAMDLPDFVSDRLDRLDTLIAMVTDAEWPLEDEERDPVLCGLAYLCDPEDLIPDDVPGIGMLDDAVMIELVFRDLQHELAAYEDFRRYRQGLTQSPVQRADAPEVAARIVRRRAQLMARMRRRRTRA